MQDKVYPKTKELSPRKGGNMAIQSDEGTAEVTDLYEAAYLVVRGLKVQAVECIPLSGALSCRLSFAGRGLEEALAEYFDKTACVNIYAFRAAYNQVNSYVHQAKRQHALRNAATGAGGAS
ncbi:MAG TPA: hypothetical protein VMW69_13990 [Spirochaetia bacterium]|nr:hypothetical protein [Spirochaetia bacterium]